MSNPNKKQLVRRVTESEPRGLVIECKMRAEVHDPALARRLLRARSIGAAFDQSDITIDELLLAKKTKVVTIEVVRITELV